MKDIIKIRQGIFETNSSSSHSFSMGPEGRFDEVLPISEDGIINVPDDDWMNYEKTNDPLTKLSYLLSFAWTISEGKWSEYRNFIYKVILDFTGASKIEFIPSEPIDHQSCDIIDPRDLKDPEFIKEFVFNSETWLYLVWDSYEPSRGFYEDVENDKTPLYIIRFDNIDEELTIYLRDINDFGDTIDVFLYKYIYLPEKNKFVKKSDHKDLRNGIHYSGNYMFGDLVVTPKVYKA